MEGQPEMEPRNQGEQLDLERGPADYEWRRWQRAQVRRNTLQLVSAVAQWILLLTCLVQLGLGFLHSSPTTTKATGQWTIARKSEVKVNVSEATVDITYWSGDWNVTNGRIQVECDGLYLVFLQGELNLDNNALLTLKVYDKGNNTILKLKEKEERKIYLVTALRLLSPNNIYLNASGPAILHHLSLGLVLLSPPNYCTDRKRIKY